MFSCQRLNEKQRRKTNIKITELREWAAILTITRTSLIALCLLIQFLCLVLLDFSRTPSSFFLINFIAETSSFTALKRPQINNAQASIKLANIWTSLGRFTAMKKKLIATTSARLKRGSKDLMRLIEVLWCMKLVNNHMREARWARLSEAQSFLKPFWRAMLTNFGRSQLSAIPTLRRLSYHEWINIFMGPKNEIN